MEVKFVNLYLYQVFNMSKYIYISSYILTKYKIDIKQI